MSEERRTVRLALKYNREARQRRRILIRLIVNRFERENRLLFEAVVSALGWKVWKAS